MSLFSPWSGRKSAGGAREGVGEEDEDEEEDEEDGEEDGISAACAAGSRRARLRDGAFVEAVNGFAFFGLRPLFSHPT